MGYNNQAVENHMSKKHEPLAQLAEHLTFNQGARGSNPRWLTTKNASQFIAERFFMPFLVFYGCKSILIFILYK